MKRTIVILCALLIGVAIGLAIGMSRRKPVVTRFAVDTFTGAIYLWPKVGDVIQWIDSESKQPTEVKFKYLEGPPCVDDTGPQHGTCTLKSAGFYKYRCADEKYCADPEMEVEPSDGGIELKHLVVKGAATSISATETPNPTNPLIYCDGGQTKVEEVNEAAKDRRIRWKARSDIPHATITFDNDICNKRNYSYPNDTQCTFNALVDPSYTYKVKADACSEGTGKINKAK